MVLGDDSIKAELIIISNSVFTACDDEPREAAVVVKGNKVISVIDREKALEYVDDNTKIYEFQDKLVMPGFHDSHVHMILSGLLEESVNLSGVLSEEEAVEITKKFVEAHPDYSWIIGFGWYHLSWKNKTLPSKCSLDKVFPDKPVLLFNSEAHGAWVNSKALELCGIDRNTLNPPYGEIAKDKAGEPTGFLYETAMGLATPKALNIPKEREEKLIKTFLKKAASYGVTSIGDIQNFIAQDLGSLEIYEALEQRGELTLRIHFVPGLRGDLEKPKLLRDKYKEGKIVFSGLKQLIDGVPTSYTGLMVEPYADKPDSVGTTFSSLDELREWILEADKEEFRVRLHACGDGAVRFALDCFEEAQNINGKRDSRHCIEHIEVVHPEDIQRFKKLGVVASMQPEHMAITEKYEDNPYIQRLGEKREKYSWAINSIRKTGAAVQLGTDYPVVDMNPMLEIYRAVTRVHNDGKPEGGWNPEEKLTLCEVLKAYTIGSAFGAFREKELGSLEAGKLADIIVLDRNLFNTPYENIRDTGILLNIVDGEIVYSKL